MSDLTQDLAKYGLTEKEYENCLSDIREKINGDNDFDWAEIVDKYRLGIHSDTLRKASQTIFGGVFVSDYYKQKEAENNDGAYLLQLRMEKEALKKERQKLRDEKTEYNRWLREEARDELICEKICENIKCLQPLDLPVFQQPHHSKREGILCFGDTHYGAEVTIKGLLGELINAYSPEVFEERMSKLLFLTVETIKKEGFGRLRVFSLGDEIDGILRVSQLMKLRYGVVEATIKYAEYISHWLNELSKHVYVDFYSVCGNHSELRLIDQPKGTFAKENMSFVINEFIRERLKDNPNFNFHKNDTGLIFENICGYNVLGIHGEVRNLESALRNFSNTYNTMIDVLVGGHKHHFASETIGSCREVVSVPSVIGIDDYSVSLGKTSNAGALMLVFEEEKGIIEYKIYKL